MFRYILGFSQDTAVSARLGKVLVASPKDIAQFVIRQGYAGEVFKAYLVEHTQEQFLNLLPPACVHVIEVGAFCQRSKIFFGSGAEIPVALFGKLYDMPTHILVRVLENVVKERIEVFPEQFAQSVVRHGFMEQGLFCVVHTRMVRYHYRDASCAA